MQLTWLCCIWKLPTSSGLWLVMCYGMRRLEVFPTIYHATNQRPHEVWSCQMQRSQVRCTILISSIWFNNYLTYCSSVFLFYIPYQTRLSKEALWTTSLKKKQKQTNRNYKEIKIKTNQNCRLSSIHTKALKNRYL